MSPETVQPPRSGGDASAGKPVRRMFRKSFATVRPSPEQMTRQADVAGAAWAALRDRDEVMAFLNTHDEALGGRPLDLALASDEGLAAVRLAVTALGRARDQSAK